MPEDLRQATLHGHEVTTWKEVVQIPWLSGRTPDECWWQMSYYENDHKPYILHDMKIGRLIEKFHNHIGV